MQLTKLMVGKALDCKGLLLTERKVCTVKYQTEVF